jgi:hypothetical protein
MQYKFRENELIKELQTYVDQTYDQHYATDKYQATDVIIDSGHGTGFCLGNVIKYAKRYGNKGTPVDARKDLMKIMHYALIQLYIHDEEHQKPFEKKTEQKIHEFHHSIDNVSPDEWNAIRLFSEKFKDTP